MKVDQRLLVNAAVEFNLPPSDYFSLWNDFAEWQFQTLMDSGLQKQHKLLDVGCGALRLGLSAIEYLDDGGYTGVDAHAPYLALGRRLAELCGLTKRFTLIQSDNFDFGPTAETFDFGMAQSVFTHLSSEDCDRCCASLARVMKRGSQFIFTYLAGRPRTVGFLYNGNQPMLRPIDTDDRYFASLSRRHGARFEALAIVHPTGQSVGRLVFGS